MAATGSAGFECGLVAFSDRELTGRGKVLWLLHPITCGREAHQTVACRAIVVCGICAASADPHKLQHSTRMHPTERWLTPQSREHSLAPAPPLFNGGPTARVMLLSATAVMLVMLGGPGRLRGKRDKCISGPALLCSSVGACRRGQRGSSHDKLNMPSSHLGRGGGGLGEGGGGG